MNTTLAINLELVSRSCKGSDRELPPVFPRDPSHRVSSQILPALVCLRAQVYVFPLTISSALCTAHSDKHLSASLCLAQPCPRSALWSMCARLGNPLTSYTEDHGAKQGRGQISNKLPPQSHRNITLQGPPGLSFAIFSMLKNHHKTLLKQSAGPHLQDSDSVALQWSPGICISNTFPGDADMTTPGTTV